MGAPVGVTTVKFGLGLNPPIIQQCIFDCPDVLSLMHCCGSRAAFGWAGQVLSLLQEALSDKYYFKVPHNSSLRSRPPPA